MELIVRLFELREIFRSHQITPTDYFYFDYIRTKILFFITDQSSQWFSDYRRTQLEMLVILIIDHWDLD